MTNENHPLADDIYRLEKALSDALEMSRWTHGNVMRAFSDGPAHPSLSLMEISLRALGQANDAARYARHALSVPSPVSPRNAAENSP